MGQDQEKKQQYVCKLCNKSFLSGRVLGGHMRIHGIIKNPVEEEIVNLENSNIMGNDGCYGLRENPKKSWKSSILNGDDSVVVSVQESVSSCRICGKQFESPRSLHGHMRHHSVEERSRIRCRECGKGFKTLRSLNGHMRLHSLKNRVSKESSFTSSGTNLVVMAFCDAKTVNLVKRKRSNRTRYKVTTPNSSFYSLNESVSGFEIDDEVEEVAMCLMMLSRGVCELDGFKSECNSLDSDSMTFEAKFSYENQRIVSSHGGIDGFDGDELVKKKPRVEEKFDSCASDSKNKASECTVCDCDMAACFEDKKIELELPLVNSSQAVDSKMPEVEDKCAKILCDAEIEKGIPDGTESSPTEDCREEVELDRAGLGQEKCTPSNNAVSYACDTEMEKDSCTEMMCATSDFNDSKKKNQFQCRICNRMFSTHQALGGHQTLHRTTKGSAALKTDHRQEDNQTNYLPQKIDATSEVAKLDCVKDSVEEEKGMKTTSHPPKKSKKHECLICCKFFVSGQALGGHKRAHHTKVREEQNLAAQQDVPDVCNAIDINLPAMIDTEANNRDGFKSWWPGSSYKHEALLDVIAT